MLLIVNGFYCILGGENLDGNRRGYLYLENMIRVREKKVLDGENFYKGNNYSVSI